MKTSVEVTGPRMLPPDDSPVRVWLDAGSGPGREILVSAGDLSLAPGDDGRGVRAVYVVAMAPFSG